MVVLRINVHTDNFYTTINSRCQESLNVEIEAK